MSEFAALVSRDASISRDPATRGRDSSLVLRRGHWGVQAGGRVSKGCVDKPTLSLSERNAPAIPGPSVLGLPVPLKVSDVPGLEVDGVPVMGTQDRDACVRTAFGLGVRTPPGLSDEERGKHYANDPKPTMLHDLLLPRAVRTRQDDAVQTALSFNVRSWSHNGVHSKCHGEPFGARAAESTGGGSCQDTMSWKQNARMAKLADARDLKSILDACKAVQDGASYSKL